MAKNIVLDRNDKQVKAGAEVSFKVIRKTLVGTLVSTTPIIECDEAMIQVRTASGQVHKLYVFELLGNDWQCDALLLIDNPAPACKLSRKAKKAKKGSR